MLSSRLILPLFYVVIALAVTFFPDGWKTPLGDVKPNAECSIERAMTLPGGSADASCGFGLLPAGTPVRNLKIIWDGMDMASYIQGGEAILKGDFDFWALRMWPPAMVYLNAALLWFDPTGPLVGYHAILAALCWGCVAWRGQALLRDGQVNDLIAIMLPLLIVLSPLVRLSFLGRMSGQSEPLAYGFLTLGGFLFFHALLIRRLALVLWAAAAWALASLFRTFADAGIACFLFGAAVICVIAVAVRAAELRDRRILIVLLTLFVHQAVTGSVRLLNGGALAHSDYVWSLPVILHKPDIPKDHYMRVGGGDFACNVEPVECHQLVEKLLQRPELGSQPWSQAKSFLLRSIVNHPVEFLKYKFPIFIQQYFAHGSLLSIRNLFDIFSLVAYAIAILIGLRSRSLEGVLLAFFCVAMPAGTVAAGFVLYFEPRYLVAAQASSWIALFFAIALVVSRRAQFRLLGVSLKLDKSLVEIPSSKLTSGSPKI